MENQNTATTQSKSNAKFFVPLMAAALFMVTGLCILIFLGREKARIIGQPLAELDIQPLLNVEKPITPEDMKGKVVILHFWGYWSTPCRQEYPGFAEVQSKFKDDSSVMFVSIACNDQDNTTKDQLAFYTEKFLININVRNSRVYQDPAEYSRTQICHLLTAGGFAYPTTIVLDRSGRVVDLWRQAVSKSTLEKTIQRALAIQAN